MTGRRDPAAVRAYRRALVLLPRNFRLEHGEAMVAMLADEWRERGRPGRVALLTRAALDLLATAVLTRRRAPVTNTERRRRTMGWSEVARDVKVSVRSLVRSPVFTATAVLSLALGVGGVATVYGLADRVLLRPIDGVEDPEALVELVPGPLSYPGYQDLANQMSTLAGLAAHRMRGVSLAPGRGVDPRPVRAGVVSGNYFDLLGVRPAHGRLLMPADNVPGAPPAAVLSHALWKEMGEPSDVTESEIRVNGAVFRVVGVAPPEFRGLRIGVEPAFWMPVESWPAASMGRTPDVHSRGWGWLSAIGRLAPGASVGTATADARRVAGSIAAIYPGEQPELSEIRVVPARTRVAETLGDVVRPLLFALGAVVALALLAAATNLANLLLGRATRRTRELGIRAALGANRFRLARLLAIETGLLVAIGLAGGLLVCLLTLRVVGGIELPGGLGLGAMGLRADARLFLLGAGTLALIMLAVGSAPAMTAAHARPVGLGGSRSTTSSGRALRLRAAFVALQVSVAVLLLAGTALFGRSIARALDVDLGFEPDGMAVITLDASLFEDDREAAAAAIDRLMTDVGSMAGIEAASWATLAPLDPGADRETFAVIGRPPPEDRPVVEFNAVGAGYFRVVGIPLLRGDARAVDGPIDSPRVVINEVMAERHWPGGNPIGDRIRLVGEELMVVGVAADARLHGFDSEPDPTAFIIMTAPASRSVNVVVRGPGAAGVLRSARDLAASVDSRFVVAETATGPQLVHSLLLPQRFGGLVLLLFASLAIGLALTGVYGVVAYAVGARVREFGIRLTLGARPDRVTVEVLRKNLLPIGGGILLGTLGSIELTRLAAPVLFGIEPNHVSTPLIAALLVLGMALLATWLPARRAGKVEPAAVLAVE